MIKILPNLFSSHVRVSQIKLSFLAIVCVLGFSQAQLQANDRVLNFDIAASMDKPHVEIPMEELFDIRQAITIECWIKISAPAVLKKWRAIVTKGNGWGLYVNDMTHQISFRTDNGFDVHDLMGTTPLVADTWYHIAAVFDGPRFTKTLYINGVEGGSANYSGRLVTNDFHLLLGENEEDPGRAFSGMMDIVRIWDIARAQGEIAADQTRLLRGNEIGLVAAWRFDETSGPVANDISANQAHGILRDIDDVNDRMDRMDGTLFDLPPAGQHAVRFTAADQYVELGSEASFDFTNQMAVEAWVHFEDIGTGDKALVSKGAGSWQLGLRPEGASARVLFTTNLGNADAEFLSDALLEANQWYHVSVVFDLVNGTETIYINGVLDISKSFYQASISQDTDDSRSIVAGDIDGDGDMDVIAGNYNTTNKIFLNNGTKDPFNGVEGIEVSPLANATTALLLQDVDQDSDLDLVEINTDAQPNRLYRNNGSGIFAASLIIGTDQQDSTSAFLGDTNGDNFPDLVVGNEGQPNRIYINSGTSNPFDNASGSDISGDADDTRSVVLADVDEDGNLDFFSGNFGQENKVYVGNGDGTFNAAVNLGTETQDTTSIEIRDVNNDKKLDAIIGNLMQENQLYLGDGTSIFAAASMISADTDATTAIVIGDVDGNGRPDILSANEDEINRIYLNNGSLDPFNGVSGIDLTSATNNTTSAVIADIDGEGSLDVLTGNSGQANQLFLSNGSTDPFSDVTTKILESNLIGLNDLPVWFGRQPNAGGQEFEGQLDEVRIWGLPIPGDWIAGNINNHVNGDEPGLVGAWSFNEGTGANANNDEAFNPIAGTLMNMSDLNRLPNETPFNAANPPQYAVGFDGQSDYIEVQGILYRAAAVALGDVDGDGDQDLAVGNENEVNRIYLNQGDGTFDLGTDISSDNHATSSVTLGDADNDGDLDFFAGNFGQPNRIYFNDGQGVFDNGASITGDSHNTQSVQLGDINKDGSLDLIVGNENEPNRLYLNNGTPQPFDGVAGMDITADEDATYEVALGDVNEDGDLDMVVGNKGQINRIYYNNLLNNLSDRVLTEDAHNTTAMAVGDVDGNGTTDLITLEFGLAPRLYLNNGTTDPFSGVTGLDIATDSLAPSSISIGDVNNDGALDVVIGNTGLSNRLYLNNQLIDGMGDPTTNPFLDVLGTEITTDADATTSILLADVNNDTFLDAIVGNDGQSNRLYLNNQLLDGVGDPTADPFVDIAGSDITADAQNTTSLVAADFNNDNFLDVIAGNRGQTNRLYLNNQLLDGLGDPTLDPFVDIAGTDITANADDTTSLVSADVNNDTFPDLVVGNAGQANRLYFHNQFMDGLGDPATDPFVDIVGLDITSDTNSTTSVVVFDVNLDGFLDVISGNDGQANHLIIHNQSIDPFNGALGINLTSAPANATLAMAATDMNGDSQTDLLIGNNGFNYLYFNNYLQSVPGRDITQDADETRAVALCDVDGDGDLDAVAGNSDGQINRLYLYNDANANFDDAINISTDTDDTYSLKLVDVDNDNDKDLLVGNQNQRNRLYLYDSGLAGLFDAGWDITKDEFDTRSISVGDIDGDGDNDLVTGDAPEPALPAYPTNHVYFNLNTFPPTWNSAEVSPDPFVFDSFTIEAWINPEGAGARTLVMKGELGYGLALNSNNELVFWHDGNRNNLLKSDGTVENENWTHVAVVVDQQSGTTTFYIDGKQSGVSPIAVTNNAIGPLFIGRLGSLDKEHFEGDLDEIRIWDHARTELDIQFLANRQLTDDFVGLAGYWNANQRNDHDELLDQSGFDRDGDFENFGLEDWEFGPVWSTPPLDPNRSYSRNPSTSGLWAGEIIVNKVNEVQTARPGHNGDLTETVDVAQVRIILHVDAEGQVRLLKDVTIMKEKTGNQDTVLVSDETLVPNFDGVIKRGGKLAGLRIGTVAY